MAFRANDYEQYSLTDKTNNLTEREHRALENSWAKVFAEEIFPSIDESRFSVLYSERTQCRSNTPEIISCRRKATCVTLWRCCGGPREASLRWKESE